MEWEDSVAVSLIKIVKNASLTVEASEEASSRSIALQHMCGLGAGSTVTYVESDTRILVDTGYEFEENLGKENREKNRRILLFKLIETGLEPSDIDIVFITHFHLDQFMSYAPFSSNVTPLG